MKNNIICGITLFNKKASIYGFIVSILMCLASCQSLQKSNPAILTLSNEVEEANQKIEEIYHRLSVVQFMVDNHQRTITSLENQLKGKTPSGGETAKSINPEPENTPSSDKISKEEKISEIPVKNTKANKQESSKNSENSAEMIYNQGFASLKNKNYTKAISLFKTLVAKFPDNDLADNAIYWTGEIHYTLHEYPAAILTFQKLVDKYPDGGKVPDALLKTGYSYYSMNDYETAKKFLKKVVVDFPFTYSGTKAEEMLKQIDNKNAD